MTKWGAQVITVWPRQRCVFPRDTPRASGSRRTPSADGRQHPALRVDGLQVVSQIDRPAREPLRLATLDERPEHGRALHKLPSAFRQSVGAPKITFDSLDELARPACGGRAGVEVA
jgi:hypothetical protein